MFSNNLKTLSIGDFNSFMLSNENIKETLHKCQEQQAFYSIIQSNRRAKDNSNNTDTSRKYERLKILPQECKDLLFWVFLRLRGFEDFKYDIEGYSGSSLFAYEKQEKINIVERVNEMGAMIFYKMYKVRKTDFTTSILNDYKISLEHFEVLCKLYNIDLIVCRNKTYYFIYNEDVYDDVDEPKIKEMLEATNPQYYLHIEKEKYFLSKRVCPDNLVLELINSRFRMNKINETLKKIGHYKLDDLQTIAQKFNIIPQENKRIKKVDLYELISRYFF